MDDEERKKLFKSIMGRVKQHQEKNIAITFKNRRCSAHQYHLEQQGDEGSRYIYRCTRSGCHSYLPLGGMAGRKAQCTGCSNIFTIDPLIHVIQNAQGLTTEDVFRERPLCTECINPTDHIREEAEREAREKARLARIEAETEFPDDDDLAPPPTGEEKAP